MEANIVTVLALMGGLSLYLVIATAVGRAVYNRMIGYTEDGKIILSVFCGALFPITVPILIVILWVNAMINIPLSDEKEDPPEETLKESPKKESKEKEEVKTKFKAGDLVTGKKGNPENYTVLYEGCVCRVLEVDPDDEDMRVILIDHIDKEAHKENIGETYDVPWENFTLIRPKKKVQKVTKKKR